MKTKTFLFIASVLLGVSYLSSSFMSPQPVAPTQSEINWLSWSEAIALNKKKPKKIFIDVYTDWCGWCKRMDKSTFKNKKVVEYMNKNFYAVKLDAEMKKDVTFKDHTFKFVSNGRRGQHELAASLLDNRMSYPSYVFMNKNVERITIAKGYQNENDLLSIMHFVAKDKYKTVSFKEYKQNWKK